MNGGEWALRGYWGTYAVPASVAMLGVALSALVYAWVERFEQDRISAEFQHRSDNIIRVLSSGVDGYANLVESYGNQTAVFTHRMRTTSLSHFLGIREEWEGSKPSIRQSIDDARKHYPGIRVMGWATRVPREQIAPFEHVAETLVTPEYDLKELGSDRVFVPLRDRQEYVPVFYAEPFEDASILLGYDLASSNKIGAALTASLERDGVTASEPIRMIREITGQLGVFIVTPIYQSANRPGSFEERADEVYTFLFAVVLVDDMLQHALAGLDEPGIVFFVYPGSEDQAPSSLTSMPVYASNDDPSSIDVLRNDPLSSRFGRHGAINVAGRYWDVYSFPTREFISNYDTWMPEIVFLFSSLFTLIVAAYLALFVGRTQRVQQLVAVRTRDLELANRSLESEIDMRRQAEAEKRGLESQLFQAQRMDSIGNLAGGVAHDFNNILLAVLGYIELSRGNESLPPKVAKYLDSAKAAGDRAVTLTRQLLAFGRRQALAVAPHDLNGVVAEFRHILDRIIPENIEFSFDLAPEPCVVVGDSGQLEQVVMNLVVNACEAMPDGGRLSVRTETVVLDAAELAARPALNAGNYVRLTVSDTGTGIAPDDLGRIFEPFYTTKEHGQGTGLGLAVVYGIVEQHGGFIEARSQVGHGSEFVVVLPRSADPAVVPKPETPVLREGGHETILVVEDEVEVQDLARVVLESAGYKVLLADSGRRGLKMYEQHRDEIALVFADVVMPEMGGRELSKAIRDLDPKMPLILTSGYLGGDDQEYFVDRDIDFIPKPYSPTVLRNEVRRVLDLAAAATK